MKKSKKEKGKKSDKKPSSKKDKKIEFSGSPLPGHGSVFRRFFPSL